LIGQIVKQWIPATIAIVVVIVVLVGYLFPSNLLSGARDTLVNWAVIVASFVFVFLGLFNIVGVHLKKTRRLQKGGVYSLVFLVTVSFSLVLSLIPIGPITPEETRQWIFDYVISPVGAALAALIVFTLTLAAFRLLRERQGEKIRSIVFILVVVVALLSSTPLTVMGGDSDTFADIRHWIVNVFGMAGMRGLLLGVALGTIITALRVLWPQLKPDRQNND
jgi:hypothetical protein